MTQRIALLIAAALGAFVIVLLGAVGAYVLAVGPAGATALAAQNSTAVASSAQAPVSPGSGAGVGSDNSQNSQVGGSTGTAGVVVTAEQAAGIALESAPGSTLASQPRLVNLRGTVAYEVALDTGYVYVDAGSGQVLFNGASGATGGNSQSPWRTHRRDR